MSALLFVGVQLTAEAQFGQFNDVSRLAFDRPTGTPRFQALGGASQALGGDFSSLVNNPAGLGWVQSGSLVFAPAFTNTSSSSTYRGTSLSADRFNANIGSVGFTFASRPEEGEDNGWYKGASFAIGLNRMQDYQSDVDWTGLAPGAANGQPIANGLVHNYLTLAQNNRIGADILRQPMLFPDQQQVRSAYSIFMLDTLSNGAFTYFLPPADYQQTMKLTTRGGRYNLDLGTGINLGDRVTLGISAGMGIYNFTEKRIYTEQFKTIYYDGANPILADSTYKNASFILEDETKSTGASFNLRIGAQFLLTKNLRLGVSAQLPTVYSIAQSYSNKLSANYNNTIQTVTRGGVQSQVRLPNNPFRGPFTVPDVIYRVTTPWKLSAGLAYTNRNFGLISADVDYIDYSTAKIESSDFDATGDNNAIKQVYQSAINARLGTELKFGRRALRFGFAHYGSPTNNNFELGYFFTKGMQVYSAGYGYRWDRGYALDLTVAYNRNNARYTAHTYTRTTEVSQGFLSVQIGGSVFF